MISNNLAVKIQYTTLYSNKLMHVTAIMSQTRAIIINGNGIEHLEIRKILIQSLPDKPYHPTSSFAFPKCNFGVLY